MHMSISFPWGRGGRHGVEILTFPKISLHCNDIWLNVLLCGQQSSKVPNCLLMVSKIPTPYLCAVVKIPTLGMQSLSKPPCPTPNKAIDKCILSDVSYVTLKWDMFAAVVYIYFTIKLYIRQSQGCLCLTQLTH